MTILEACVEVLKTADRPMNTRELLDAINERKLYAFKAKDPMKVISSAIRNNLKTGQPPRISEVDKGRFAAV